LYFLAISLLLFGTKDWTTYYVYPKSTLRLYTKLEFPYSTGTRAELSLEIRNRPRCANLGLSAFDTPYSHLLHPPVSSLPNTHEVGPTRFCLIAGRKALRHCNDCDFHGKNSLLVIICTRSSPHQGLAHCTFRQSEWEMSVWGLRDMKKRTPSSQSR